MKKIVIAISVFLFFVSSSGYVWTDTRDSDSPFGVLEFLTWQHDFHNYHYANFDDIEKSVKLMREANVAIVRIDFLWYDLEPSPGVFNFEWHDKIVNLLIKNDIKVLGILHYNPLWDNEPWNKPPNPEYYIRYACATVGHFRDRIKYWEIWNEPDEKFYWVPQDDMKTYTELLKKVYPAMKKIDPTCKILMGGVSKTIVLSLKRIYKNGGKDYFDIVNIHPFVSPLYPNSVDMVHGIYKGVFKTMQEYGDENKKIWFTEIGCPGIKKPTRENGWWEGLSPNEKQQAEWVEKVYTNCLKWKGVDKVFWAFFRDTDNHFKSGVDYFGLIRYDFSKKPSYKTYKEIAK